MSNSTHLYSQLMYFLRQYSHHCDLRHLKALAWMVSGLVSPWTIEPNSLGTLRVQSCTEGAKCGAALATLYGQRADSSEGTVPAVGDGCLKWLARIIDFTWHWTRRCYGTDTACSTCLLSVVDEPFHTLWRVLEHRSATVAFGEYQGLLRQAHWLLRHHPDVMLLADRGNACS